MNLWDQTPSCLTYSSLGETNSDVRKGAIISQKGSMKLSDDPERYDPNMAYYGLQPSQTAQEQANDDAQGIGGSAQSSLELTKSRANRMNSCPHRRFKRIFRDVQSDKIYILEQCRDCDASREIIYARAVNRQRVFYKKEVHWLQVEHVSD